MVFRGRSLAWLRNLFCLLTSFAFVIPADAQDLKFELYGIDEGMSQSSVSCIIQDKKGFMWFGTLDGLNKYDGYTFTVYKRALNNGNSLRANDIKAIAEDATGNLWIATWGGGLSVFYSSEERFEHFLHDPKDPASIASNHVRALLFDSGGNLWIGTSDSGLDLFDPAQKKFIHYTKNDKDPGSLGSNAVISLYEDDQQNIWAGTLNGGISILDRKTNTFTRLVHNPKDPASLPNNVVQFIRQDSKKNIWVGTYGGGLRIVDRENLTFKTPQTTSGKPLASALLSMTEDHDGNLWFGTENQGLVVYNPEEKTIKTYHHYDNDNTTIGANSLTALYTDRKGNVWIGAYQGGVNLLNRDALKFKHYRHNQSDNSISSNTIAGLFEDTQGNLWISTDGGGLNLLHLGNKSITHFNKENGLPSNHVLTVGEDINKKIWIGTWAEGITVYDPRTRKFKPYKTDPHAPRSISSNYIFSILRDSQDRLWVGTYGNGLNLYTPKTDDFTRYTHDDKDPASISINYILTLFEDSKGRLWIGTDGGGINLFDQSSNTFTAFTHSETTKSISNNIVSSICEDAEGYLWLGTNAGLNKFDPNRKTIVASYFTEQGLPSDVITGILADSLNNIWIGTTKGLSRLTPPTGKFKNFTLSDGIQGNEFRTACRGKNGLMYFGGKNGFNEFNPYQVKSQSYDPPIVITNFRIFNKEVPISTDSDKTPLKASITETKDITLSHLESVITFDFASLNYTGIDKKQYRYMLKGLDKDWNYVGKKNTVTYTTLNPGDYTLRIGGLTNEGAWSDATVALHITVTPPFWKTWWFKLIALLVLSGVIGLSFYLRLSYIKQRNKELQSEVEKRTTELTEANYSLIESNEEVKSQNEKLEELNLEMVRKSDKILEQQEKILLQNHTLEETVDKLEKTNQTKDLFFSILAHDLKNPVSALTGITDILKAKVEILSPKEVNHYIDNINRSSHAVNKLLLDLLDWAKTHTYDIPYTPVSISVNDLIVKNLSLVEQQVRAKFIHLETGTDPGHFIHGDYQMVDTIVRNLLNNSIKFTPINGTISISSQALENDINIILRDSGVGMTEEQIQNLFKIDKKEISTGTAGETGTGIGLIVTKEFLDANKGSITVTSKLGTGSEFSVRLPRAATSPMLVPDNGHSIQPDDETARVFALNRLPDDKIAKIKGKRILIVDDNKEIRAFLRLLLSSLCEIYEAENGVQGLEAAVQYQPAIIISDMIMPLMNGLEFCKRIKTDTSTSHIPVILLTSQTEDEHQLSGYEAGADVYLMKPVRHHILFQVIHNILLNQERIHQRYASSQEIYPEDLALNALDEAFMKKVTAYIEEHLSESTLDYKRICELTAMSRSLLYLKIKTLTGHGVHDLIKSIRLKKGLQFLLEGRLNITQISFEVGFATPSHFSKTFIKHHGVPPSEYLANLKKKQTAVSGDA